MSKRNLFLLLLFLIGNYTHAQTSEVKYYNLVIDKLELPSCLKDTTALGEITLYISYDPDRTVYYSEKITLSTKSPTIIINQKIIDIKREDKISFSLVFKETGFTGSHPKDRFSINNLKLEFENTFSAISEGKRQFLAKNLGYWDDFTNLKFLASVTLYWHLEPSKLQ